MADCSARATQRNPSSLRTRSTKFIARSNAICSGCSPATSCPTRTSSSNSRGRNDLERLVRSQRFPHDKNVTLGVTETRGKGDQFEHRIHILSGLRKSRVAAVCAHEYTHAWLHENVVAGRKLDSDTIEGFCELVAFKLVSDRNDAAEKKIILDNSYTSGQIHSLVKAEDRYRFPEIVKWMKDGVDDKVDLGNTARVLVRKNDDDPIQVAWQPAKPTAVPDTLVLRGISGTPQRRFALVNDTTLEKGEQAKVRVGSSNVVVRCVEIADASVVLTVNGASQQTRLSAAVIQRTWNNVPRGLPGLVTTKPIMQSV